MMPELALPEGGEWIVILVIVVLLFGAKKLPELTRNAAKAMKEFEKARQGTDDETPAQVTQAQGAQPQPQAAQPQPQAAQSQAAQPQSQAAQPQPQAPLQTQSQTGQPQAQVQTQPVEPATPQAPVQPQPVQPPAPQSPTDGTQNTGQ